MSDTYGYDVGPRYRCMTKGYVYLHWPEHPNANAAGRVREHIAVAAGVLGKPIPRTAVVHHVNDTKDDNRPSNLVICQNDSYHKLLHQRRRVYRAGGNPDTDAMCSTCQKPRPKTVFSPTSHGKLGRECRPCLAARTRAYKARKREETHE